MTKVLNFNSSLGELYFWSDLHFSHAKDFILNPRGFSNAEDHKKAIVQRWNAIIPKDGIVFLLGDSVVGAGADSFLVFKNLLNTLNYKELYIMPGNHAAGYNAAFDESYEKNKIDKYYRLRSSFREGSYVYLIPNYYEIRIDGRLIVMSHYPLLSWNEMSKGSFHLFGHVHDNLKKKQWINDNFLTGKCADMTVEAVSEPISFQRIESYMKAKEILNVDHH